MKATWIPTNRYYHQILESSDYATRHQFYLKLIVEPWQPMMTMVTGDSNGDALAGARAWKWLLPEQTEQIGALLAQMEAAHAWQVGADALEKAVADYLVMEGTAESFATALFGADKVGDYATGLTADEFAQARRLISQGLQATGFNVLRSYIFGDALAEQSGFAPLGGMPRYGGYAIGYHVVQEFLRRSGLSITETTFLPANEIVAGSGVFAE